MSSAAIHRAHTEQKLSILAECGPSDALAVLDVEPESPDGASSSARRIFASFGAGSFRGGATSFFVLRTPRGSLHFYAQPYDGRVPLPGEHHVVVPVATPAPAVFSEGFLGGDWSSPDASFHKWLRDHPITRVLRKASFEWKLGAGTVNREWLAQLRPLGDGTTQLVMAGTGERSVALHTRPVGFATLTNAVIALVQKGAHGAAAARTELLARSVHEAVFDTLCRSGAALPVLPRADVTGRDLGTAIHAFLAPRAGGKLHVHPVPAKKEANARTNVVAREAQHLPIVALVDLTMLGSASDALVLTPSHAFYRNGDARIWFAWSEVRGVDARGGDADTVRVLLAERGWVALDCGGHAAAIGALLHELAQIPPARG
ncbi:hypothetical protein [Sandaracinus amylolyticus]|uniref:Uncharacterized protein n=1 Tax=Sandaracinus amylolyticus TaxID=927083 RepID=A0A0F6W1M3_9BACT|nr:hypothetical protein [Sandaracinus amylolyticus]AKF05200.1 hypothetical protein DB32_002349 [Sandaracinus amylolyticus]